MRKEVPSKAVRMRKTKKAARFGARAVPREQRVKRKAVEMQIWMVLERFLGRVHRGRLSRGRKYGWERGKGCIRKDN